jgi:6-phosphogluconate dehydrogenase
MQLGMIGLGRMGANMVRRLMAGGHQCVVFDLNPDNVKRLAGEGASGAASLGELVSALARPRIVWVMVPAGGPTETTMVKLGGALGKGDIVVDGGNSFFKDDIRRAKALAEAGIDFVDAGTSGGVWGVERGYCLMIGGRREAVARLEPVFDTLAPGPSGIERTPGRSGPRAPSEKGYLHCGPVGAGHFVKMVHNGIEYGLMQAYAEGFDILAKAASSELAEDQRYTFALADIAEVWRRGSVISSWLLDLAASALCEDEKLTAYEGFVHDSGEGRWTIQAAIEEAVPTDVLSAALYARFRSRQEHTFGEKVLSAMRYKFGGHLERPTGG